MKVIRGLVLALVAFAAAFALHIVGGATDQPVVFGLAVGLIFVIAATFPVVALLLAGRVSAADRNLIINVGLVIAIVLMSGALWATNDRSFAWWTVPGAAGIAFVASLTLRRELRRFTDR